MKKKNCMIPRTYCLPCPYLKQWMLRALQANLVSEFFLYLEPGIRKHFVVQSLFAKQQQHDFFKAKDNDTASSLLPLHKPVVEHKLVRVRIYTNPLVGKNHQSTLYDTCSKHDQEHMFHTFHTNNMAHLYTNCTMPENNVSYHGYSHRSQSRLSWLWTRQQELCASSHKSCANSTCSFARPFTPPPSLDRMDHANSTPSSADALEFVLHIQTLAEFMALYMDCITFDIGHVLDLQPDLCMMAWYSKINNTLQTDEKDSLLCDVYSFENKTCHPMYCLHSDKEENPDRLQHIVPSKTHVWMFYPIHSTEYHIRYDAWQNLQAFLIHKLGSFYTACIQDMSIFDTLM